VDFLESLQECAIRETLEEVGVEIAIDRLLCVTDHLLPDEAQHWVSPAYLARPSAGEARNCEPEKTREVRWFHLHQLPPNLTMTARNAIYAYVRRSPLECGGLPAQAGSPPPLTP
jgi:8-oxo-dGTP diphosphatase